jgi:hypothetical protein
MVIVPQTLIEGSLSLFLALCISSTIDAALFHGVHEILPSKFVMERISWWLDLTHLSGSCETDLLLTDEEVFYMDWSLGVHCPRAGPGRVEAIFSGPDPGPGSA